jgi:hypothetical protein
LSTQFSKMILKASTLCSAKVLSQKDSKISYLVLQGEKKTHFSL